MKQYCINYNFKDVLVFVRFEADRGDLSLADLEWEYGRDKLQEYLKNALLMSSYGKRLEQFNECFTIYEAPLNWIAPSIKSEELA